VRPSPVVAIVVRRHTVAAQIDAKAAVVVNRVDEDPIVVSWIRGIDADRDAGAPVEGYRIRRTESSHDVPGGRISDANAVQAVPQRHVSIQVRPDAVATDNFPVRLRGPNAKKGIPRHEVPENVISRL